MKILDEVRWGIIGCGDVCEVKSGPAFSKIPNSTLVAVMRRDREKARDYATRNNVPKFYDDAAALIADDEVNAVYIATPPAFHEQYAVAAIRAGKPVYIEKPVTPDSAACVRIIKAAREHGVPVSVAHYRRGLPVFKKIRALVDGGAIGKVSLIQVITLQATSPRIHEPGYWRIDPSISGGGLFFDLAPHQLDIFYWMFGATRDVHGFSLNQRKQYAAADLTTVEGIYKNDICLQGVWAFNVDPSSEEEVCHLFGAKGKISFSFFKKSDILMVTSAGTERMVFDYPEHIQQPMIGEVVEYFRGAGPNPCALEEALATISMMEKR